MNFSKFSQNKLDKEQMMAVKGGFENCEERAHFYVDVMEVFIKECITNGISKCGYSYANPGKAGWGWLEVPCQEVC